MQSFHGNSRSKAFLIRLLLGLTTDQDPEEFAQQELDIMRDRNAPLKTCEHGLPEVLCPKCREARMKEDV